MCVHFSLQDLLNLVEIMLVLPVTSAQCERVFSAQARIKTDTRSSLATETLEDLIRLTADGPTLQEFQAQPVVDRWLNSAARRMKYKQWPSEFDTASIDSEEDLQ